MSFDEIYQELTKLFSNYDVIFNTPNYKKLTFRDSSDNNVTYVIIMLTHEYLSFDVRNDIAIKHFDSTGKYLINKNKVDNTIIRVFIEDIETLDDLEPLRTIVELESLVK